MKEFAHERDRRSNREIHGDFVIVDGLFSNCSKEDLWKGALGSLKESHGSFQMIGFLHDVSFINDFGIFPVIFVGEREQGDDSTENSSSEWYTVYQAHSRQDIRFAKGYEKQAMGSDDKGEAA